MDIGYAIWCPHRTLLVVVFHSLETSIYHPENECRRLVGSTLILKLLKRGKSMKTVRLCAILNNQQGISQVSMRALGA